MFILIETFPGLGIIARWGNIPISMVLRSQESLKSEMLSLARTSIYEKILVCYASTSQRRTAKTERTHQTT